MPRKVKQCKNCGLYEHRLFIVKGRGSIPAKILMIGEAPGKNEDRKGIPFVGASGKLLDVIIDKACELSTIGLPTIYITNIVQCRPTDYFGGENRTPSHVEIMACRKNLMEIYDKINPLLTIFIGKEAVKYYQKIFKPNDSILHPAYLLRQGGKKSPYFLSTVRKLSELFSKVNSYAT